MGTRESDGNTNAALRLGPYLSPAVLLCAWRERTHVRRFRRYIFRWRGKAVSDDGLIRIIDVRSSTRS